MTIVAFCKYLVLSNFLKRSLNNSKNWMDLILHMDLMFLSSKNYVVYEIKILFASPSVNMLIPGNILTLFQCYLLLIWAHNVGQRQINVEITFHISTLEFTTSNNVESTLCISTLNNVETTLSFSTLRFTILVNVETALWKWSFLKRTKKNYFKLNTLNSKF